MVPVREPSGGWALAVDQTNSSLLGIAVTSPAGTWRIVSVSDDDSRFKVRDLDGWSDSVRFVALPDHPRPAALQSFVANSALVGSQCILPLAPKPGIDGLWVKQWALLKLAEQFGAIWRDPEQRGSTMLTVGGVPGDTAQKTGFRSLGGSIDANGPASISASGPPFTQVPRSEDFYIDPELERSPAVINGIQLRACRPTDLQQVKDLLEKEPTAFDDTDLDRVELEIQLATRAGRLAKPLAGHLFPYASADYWVLIGKKDLKETVLGVVGILQFYGVPDEVWIGYLCRHGSVLTETILRQSRELGFAEVLVWTTPDNQKAIDWYGKRAGFIATSAHPHEDLLDKPFVAFVRPTLPPPVVI